MASKMEGDEFEDENNQHEDDGSTKKREGAGNNNVTSRTKITSLRLTQEKLELFKHSQFFELLGIKNSSPSSATLIRAICNLYVPEKKMFVLNSEVSFTFCACDVANVIGIKNEGKKEKDCSCTKSTFPPFLSRLQRLYGNGNNTEKTALLGTSLKNILKEMVFVGEESKLQYQQLMCYYIIERFLIPTTDSSCRISFYKYVHDLKEFESINWAEPILKSIFDAVLKIKCQKQKLFGACSPVFEAMIYHKLPKLGRKVGRAKSSLPIDEARYFKKSFDKWTKELRIQKEFRDTKCYSRNTCHINGNERLLRQIKENGDFRTSAANVQNPTCQPLRPLNITNQVAQEELSQQAYEKSVGMVSVMGYQVKTEYSSLLTSILSKHGDICANSSLSSVFRSFYMEQLCEILRKLCDTSIGDITEHELQNMSAILRDIEKASIEIGWLKARLEDIYEAKMAMHLLDSTSKETLLHAKHKQIVSEKKEEFQVIETEHAANLAEALDLRNKLRANEAKAIDIRNRMYAAQVGIFETEDDARKSGEAISESKAKVQKVVDLGSLVKDLVYVGEV